jgi:glycosyltransferase involved in cell wall biosynthesis
LNVVHISASDLGGGAARAAYRLHVGLRRAGCESTMLVVDKRSDDFHVARYQFQLSLAERLKRRVRNRVLKWNWQTYEAKRPKGLEPFSSDQSQVGGDVSLALPLSGIINLHWVAGFIDYNQFFSRVPNRTPVVWTLHDMNPFTGGCHYALGCSAYISGCGSCPQLGSTTQRDLAFTIFHRKRRAVLNVANNRLHIVSPSHWLARQAGESAVFRNLEISVIPNGLDVDSFQPRNKQVAREALGIDQKAKVVLFIAESISVHRKGLDLLLDALDALSDVQGLCLLTAGSGNFMVQHKVAHCHMNHVNSDRILSVIYSAADVLVAPSRQENLAQTAIEAMACGTPVVAFQVGGFLDIVRPGLTGLLAKAADVRELRDCIARLLSDSALRAEMAANCRQVVLKEYSLELQAKRYLCLYESLSGEQVSQSPDAQMKSYLSTGKMALASQ